MSIKRKKSKSILRYSCNRVFTMIKINELDIIYPYPINHNCESYIKKVNWKRISLKFVYCKIEDFRSS